MKSIDLDVKVVKPILLEFIQDQVRGAGKQHAVIGLSGGIDSSLACVLTAAALGPENVLAVRMPYKTSSPESLSDAQLIIDQTGVQSKTIEITPMVDDFISIDPAMSLLRKGNLMARTRMVILYDQSAAFDGLVVGTGNKTEALLGYTTLYGDSACAFNPLGDLYKTQVRQLSREIGIPERIIRKAPSADLWAGQTDESELGFTYAHLDDLFFAVNENQLTPEDCVTRGMDADFVRRALERVLKNQFKRTLPPVARIN